MEEEIKVRFDELEKRFGTTEKRIDDIKWYIGGFAGLFAIVFSALTITMSWNYSNERTSLREFQRDLKAELGKIESLPELEILGVDGASLDNQEISAEFKTSGDGSVYFVLNCIIRNKGSAASGLMYEKFYASDPIRLPFRSTDESKFKYETYISPKQLEPNEIPGKYSNEWFNSITLKDKVKPPPGKYPMLIKLFYGKGKVTQAVFTLIVRE